MKKFAKAAIALLATASLAAPALAQETATAANSPDSADTPSEKSTMFFSAKAVSETQLRVIAGREDTVQVSNADQQAAVTRNSVGDNVSTGAAQIDGNAFQNMSGLSILNVNTGNNVAINAAMNVNISISPSP